MISGPQEREREREREREKRNRVHRHARKHAYAASSHDYAGHLRKRAPHGIRAISTDRESKDNRNAEWPRVRRLSGNPNDAYLSSARYVLNVTTMRYLADRYRWAGEGIEQREKHES